MDNAISPNITLFVDWNGTLEADEALMSKLGEFQNNKVDVYVCTSMNMSNNIFQEWFAVNGFAFDPAKNYVNGRDKPSKEFWENLMTEKNIDKNKALVIDDKLSICKAAEAAGITAVEWKGVGKPLASNMDDLHAAMTTIGYKPL